MVKVIQDLWILSKSGIVIFSRVFDQKVNDQLFGALMTALDTLSNELAEGGLTSFELSSIRFTILKSKEYIFIANSSKKVKEKKILDELKRISERFFTLYSNKLNNWDHNLNHFAGFEKEIDDSLEQTIKKFQNGFW